VKVKVLISDQNTILGRSIESEFHATNTHESISIRYDKITTKEQLHEVFEKKSSSSCNYN